MTDTPGSTVHWLGEIHAIVLNEIRDIVGMPFKVITTITDETLFYEFIFLLDETTMEMDFEVPNDDTISTDEIRGIILGEL